MNKEKSKRTYVFTDNMGYSNAKFYTNDKGNLIVFHDFLKAVRNCPVGWEVQEAIIY